MRMRTSLWLLAGSFAAVGCSSDRGDVGPVASVASSVSPMSFGAPGVHRGDRRTRSPIKHAIVIIGENRTFDHLFATYKPKRGQQVDNLLSKQIINEDGSPGPNFALTLQNKAVNAAPSPWALSPGSKTPYGTLPPPLSGGPKTAPFATIADAKNAENGLADEYYKFLTTGGTGFAKKQIDTRIANVSSLRPGPFQLTGPTLSDDDYAASPVHRFYQMWQQLDCNRAYATGQNPSGCLEDLFPWVEVTVGAGTNGKPQPAGFNDASTGEGATAMEFYNMAKGDIAYTKELADTYAFSDNFHQSVEGGTGANHIMLGTGDCIWYSDSKGNAAVPPSNEIENPDPQPGTNNWYTEDGYGSADAMGNPIGGGSYSDCADPNQPGVSTVVDYLSSLHVNSRCESGHYYLLNNYAPGYFGDGTVNTGATNPFTVPPSTVPTIGDQLLAKDISFAYFGDEFNRYLKDPNYNDALNNYCDICNFFQYSTSIMTNDAVRTEHLKDTIDLYSAIANGNLPAVSFVKPSGFVDGHPASSKWDLFEGFVKKIVDQVKSQPELWEDTAIFVTADEGGGYYDSGYVQAVDFFGDGTRIPMVVASPYAKGGRVSHEYTDHVSILKFIERNWGLHPITKRSRDNLPNPVQRRENPYAPVNGAAIGDLFDLFDFDR
jgi:phospholipase C